MNARLMVLSRRCSLEEVTSSQDWGHGTSLPRSEPHARVGRSPGGHVEVVFRARP